MKGARRFTAAMTSDAKRLVRGEHWLMARTSLRQRDVVHHRAWTVLMLAGEHPADEINSIRSVMHLAKIVAVDRNPAAVQAAREAGADVAIECDVGEFPNTTALGGGFSIRHLPAPIAEHGPYDVINLDLCGDVVHAAKLIKKYSCAAAATHGVFMLTFSYGRDVAEVYDASPFGDVPSPLGGRVRMAAEMASNRMRIASVLAYPGNQMPMCACLWQFEYGRAFKGKDRDGEPAPMLPPKSFSRVGDADLYASAMLFDRVDPAMLYATPADRIVHFRHVLAAAKAHSTRNAVRSAVENAVQELVAENRRLRDQIEQQSKAVTVRTWDELERDLITRSLQQHNGRKGDAAKAIGYSRNTFTRKLKKHGITARFSEEP